MLRHFFLYLLLQTSVAVIVYQLKRPQTAIVAAYLASMGLATLMYLLVHLKDPGYIDTFQNLGLSICANPTEQSPPTDQRRLSKSQPQVSGSSSVKLRECIICHSFQPLRTKHCHECNRCVLTFDHHCPFTGNCVGEKNKALFYLYLAVQLSELVLVVQNSRDYYVGFLFSLMLVLATLLVCLLCFHTVLMVKGITTWEFFSWKNITYMAGVPPRNNPFSKSIAENIRVYWRVGFTKEPHCWTFQ